MGIVGAGFFQISLFCCIPKSLNTFWSIERCFTFRAGIPNLEVDRREFVVGKVRKVVVRIKKKIGECMLGCIAFILSD